MNILLMVSWYGEKGDVLTGGNFHYELAEELKKHCNVAIYYPYDRTITVPYTSDIEWGILTYRSGYALSKKIRNRRYMYMAMKNIVREFKPDIIHGQVATEAGRFAVMLGEMFHIPVMISEHSAVEASGVKEFPHYYYAKRVYGHSVYNTCVSDDLTKKLQIIFPKYQFHTIYNGIKKIEINEHRNEYRRKDYVNIVMIAGLYDRYIKGLQYMLPVMKSLKEEGKKAVLHFIGDGEYLEEYRNKASEMQMADNCIFYGFCEKEKVYAILSEMDFFVCASIFESFSCATVEAMMMGKPVVATRCGGPDTLVNEISGILVEKESEQALYDGISYMTENYMNYSPEKIKAYANDHFSVERICEKYLEIYRMICDKKI